MKSWNNLQNSLYSFLCFDSVIYFNNLVSLVCLGLFFDFLYVAVAGHKMTGGLSLVMDLRHSTISTLILLQ